MSAKSFYRDKSNFQADSYSQDLENNLYDFEDHYSSLTVHNFNDAFNEFTAVISGTIDTHAPLKPLSRKQRRLKSKPWLTKAICVSIHKEQSMFKSHFINGDSAEKSFFKKYSNRLTKIKTLSKKLHFKSEFEKYHNDPRKTWETIRSMLHSKSSSSSSLPTSLKLNGSTIQDQTLISNYFNNFFCSIGENLSNSAASQENYEFRDYLSNRVSSSIFLDSPSLSEIVKSIQSLNMNKALGHGNISQLFLKTARDIVAPFLQVFIDFFFKNRIFPDNCKTAKLFPLHKKGDVKNPSNFRPISILSCFSKIYEQVLHNRLVKFLGKHNVITPTQYGFQKGISTTHAILDIVTNAFDNIHKKKFSGLIFLDLQKAFDTVNHSILLSKLDHYGIRGPANRLIESFLDRKQYVCLSGCRSDLKSIKYGVAQGSKIGPLLFFIYINDLPNSVHCIPRLFADDTCLLLADANLNSLHENINNELINLSHWCKANKLSVNPVKSNAMIISPKQCNA